MQYFILAVGRWKASPEKALYEKFRTRIQSPVQLKEVSDKKPLKGSELLHQEGKLLLDAVPDKALLVALDSSGIGLSSLDLASNLGAWRNDGVRSVAFLIGGANGHDATVLERANLILSFGPQTWPHMMVRAMLLEQLYRAESILAGHPYHRE